MAAKKQPTTIKKFTGKANKFIKYNGKYIKAGEEFEVAEKDVEELKQHAQIEEQDVEVSSKVNDEKKDNSENADNEKLKEGEGQEGE